MDSIDKVGCEYTLRRWCGEWKHTWSVKDDKMALHLHITSSRGEFYGGFECHYRNPPDYMQGQAPSHDDCWLLRAPCWHDGTSTWAQEHWIPMWQRNPNDHEFLFRQLAGELKKRRAELEPEPEEVS